MSTVHLYLQPGPSELRIVRRTFAAGKCTTTRESWPLYGSGAPGEEIATRLAAELAKPEVRGVCRPRFRHRRETWTYTGRGAPRNGVGRARSTAQRCRPGADQSYPPAPRI